MKGRNYISIKMAIIVTLILFCIFATIIFIIDINKDNDIYEETENRVASGNGQPAASDDERNNVYNALRYIAENQERLETQMSELQRSKEDDNSGDTGKGSDETFVAADDYTERRLADLYYKLSQDNVNEEFRYESEEIIVKGFLSKERYSGGELTYIDCRDAMCYASIKCDTMVTRDKVLDAVAEEMPYNKGGFVHVDEEVDPLSISIYFATTDDGLPKMQQQ